MFRACGQLGSLGRKLGRPTSPRARPRSVRLGSRQAPPTREQPSTTEGDRARRRRRHRVTPLKSLPAACVPTCAVRPLSPSADSSASPPPSRVAPAARAAWTLASAAAGKSGGDAAAPSFCSRAPPRSASAIYRSIWSNLLRVAQAAGMKKGASEPSLSCARCGKPALLQYVSLSPLVAHSTSCLRRFIIFCWVLELRFLMHFASGT
jgi:hypothetical protein